MLSDLKKTTLGFLSDNSSALLTAGGVVGTVATAVLTGRASVKAFQLIEAEQEELEALVAQTNPDPSVGVEPKLSTVIKFRIAAPHFIGPVVMGSVTIGSIVMANRMSAQKAAVLATAYGLSQKQLDEYRSKIEEKLSPKKAEEIRDEVQADRVANNPPQNQTIIIGAGDIVCYDSYSDRYHKTNVEKIRKAEQAVMHEILDSNSCSLSVFYDELGWKQNGLSNDVGWNTNTRPEVSITTLMGPDQSPILAIEFKPFPMFDFDIDTKH